MSDQAKHTPGPWIMSDVPGHGIEIKAKIPPPRSEHGEELLTVYEVPIKPSFQVGEDGKLYALLTYEQWVQFPDQNWNDTQTANAHLIASAPELLKALEAAIAEDETHGKVASWFRQAEAAIAKAKGIEG